MNRLARRVCQTALGGRLLAGRAGPSRRRANSGEGGDGGRAWNTMWAWAPAPVAGAAGSGGCAAESAAAINAENTFRPGEERRLRALKAPALTPAPGRPDGRHRHSEIAQIRCVSGLVQAWNPAGAGMEMHSRSDCERRTPNDEPIEPQQHRLDLDGPALASGVKRPDDEVRASAGGWCTAIIAAPRLRQYRP